MQFIGRNCVSGTTMMKISFQIIVIIKIDKLLHTKVILNVRFFLKFKYTFGELIISIL